ncbi:membrane lipoprotein lipid attachment site-containing protein [Sporosarcina sp. Marseille-Q4063]|uniref:membrane lipoprotein lipid attachment site-containing protein n=1 Tax=Sporosarcina sp. Marseille-Q4063 TaxID=2810514 RepID=UPI001BAFF2E4|nr:membrane lipoprotein lipid attachment site-containing protein [Sporosarcina sp. Marseille-Q4063]QUW20283.1 membrane lipoprotein lipid attachment site-containing protein [Sporosarcina sp. Marseille-Q4063]
MKKLLMLVGLIFLLSGCNSNLTYTEINSGKANKDLRSFLEVIDDENGAYLYYNGEKEIYIFLNGRNVQQGDKAAYFTKFDVEGDGDTLNVFYEVAYTEDDSNENLKHQALYKIRQDQKYDKIQAFANGAEVPFEMVSGSGK